MDQADREFARRHAHAYIAPHYGDEMAADYAAWYAERFVADADGLEDLPAHGSVWGDWLDAYERGLDEAAGYVEVENLTPQR